MEAKFEESIFRLNNKIKELLFQIEIEEKKNAELKFSNRNLFQELQDVKHVNEQTSILNLKYKNELEAQVNEKEQLADAQQKLKVKYNSLSQKFAEQNEKLKTLENGMKTLNSAQRLSRVPIVESVSEIQKEKHLKVKVSELQKRLNQAENELTEAYNVIDELEFELETIDYLECEIERLQQQVDKLKNGHQKQQRQGNDGGGDELSFSPFSLLEIPKDDDAPNDDAIDAMGIKKLDHEHDNIDENQDKPVPCRMSRLRRQSLSKKLEVIHERKSLLVRP